MSEFVIAWIQEKRPPRLFAGVHGREHMKAKGFWAAIGLAVIALCIMLAPAVGQNLVVNGSFEAITCNKNGPGSGESNGLSDSDVPGWSIIPKHNATYPLCVNNPLITFWGPTPYGNQWLILGDHFSGVQYAIQQTISGLIPGNTYKLSFAIASQFGCCSVVEVSFPSGSSTAAQTFTAAAASPISYNSWTIQTMNVVANNSSVTLQFKDVGLPSGIFMGGAVGLDNVTLGTPSPCDVPTGETTAQEPSPNGWDVAGAFDRTPNPTMGRWIQTLTSSNGTNFSGRFLLERNARPGFDGCYNRSEDGSAIDPVNEVSGGDWTVRADNTWGPDIVGYRTPAVVYYRAKGRAPCGFVIFQRMVMECPDGSFQDYGTVNDLKGRITATTVTSVRADGTATRRYP
jgi:hypothetical protein